MVIGQAPGITETKASRPFNAGSGRRLFQWLAAAGWEEDAFRREHYLTAVTKCYPGKQLSNRGDRVPSQAEQALCRPYLVQEIALVRPRLIITTGRLAASLFFADRPLDAIVGQRATITLDNVLETLAGGVATDILARNEDMPKGHGGVWIVPLPHPSGASQWLNRPENRRLLERSIALLAELKQSLL
jgi:uracil-DNA glycosylase